MNRVLRLSKILLVASVALTVSIAVFDNLTDYQTNWTFVSHVLSMDTLPRGSPIRYRAIVSPVLQECGYWLIIGIEAVTAVLCWAGVLSLLYALHEPAAVFARAKKWSIAGLTLGFIVWHVGFAAIGGEWFGMWQSTLWNGEASAFRFYMTIVATLIYLSLPDRGVGVDQKLP